MHDHLQILVVATANLVEVEEPQQVQLNIAGTDVCNGMIPIATAR